MPSNAITKENEKDKENRTLFLAKKFDLLYEKNYPLIIFLIKKYNFHLTDPDDAISLANECFTQTINKYDVGKTNFSTYLGMVIKGRFSRDARDKKAFKRNDDNYFFESLQQTVNTSKGDSKDISLEEILELETVSLENRLISEVFVSDFMKYLKKKQKGDEYHRTLQLRMQGYNQFEIAKAIGISQPQVSRHLIAVKNSWLDFTSKKQIEHTLTKEKLSSTYKKGGPEMKKPKNSIDTLEQVIQLIAKNVTETEDIAAELNLSKQLAKTYRFAALREIEKRNGQKETPQEKVLKEKHEMPQEEIDDITIEMPQEEIIQEEKEIAPNTKQKAKIKETPIHTTKEKKSTTISGTNIVSAISTNSISKRLKPTVVVVASNDFEFKIESDFIVITMLSNGKTLTLPKEKLQNLIGDLEQIIKYL